MAGFADIRRQMRRDVHAAFAVSATYEDPFTELTPITVRLHNQTIQSVGGINDYAAVLEAIDKLVFNAEELAALGITLTRKGVVKLVEYGGYEMVLDSLDPPDGPLKIVWAVDRPKQTVAM